MADFQSPEVDGLGAGRAVDPYYNPNYSGPGGSRKGAYVDPYAEQMLGAYDEQLKYAQSLQGQPSAAAQQVRRDSLVGGQQTTQMLGAQAGAMGANPAMAREASYGGTQARGQMRQQGKQDANVLQTQQDAANQQLMQQTLQQRAMYEQMMRDDATRRFQGNNALYGQLYDAETQRYIGANKADLASDQQWLGLAGAAIGAGGSLAGAMSDRRLKRRAAF